MSQRARFMMVLKTVRDIRQRSHVSQVNVLIDEVRKLTTECRSMRDLMYRITFTGT
jgi:U3 small nucleolar RNA-associated protein 14